MHAKSGQTLHGLHLCSAALAGSLAEAQATSCHMLVLSWRCPAAAAAAAATTPSHAGCQALCNRLMWLPRPPHHAILITDQRTDTQLS